jgi:3-vinyl bacteriochlorophyllide hydratase
MSMLVMVLHTAYVAELWLGRSDSHQLMMLALAAYASYLVNAAQYVLKLRAARRSSDSHQLAGTAMGMG